MDSFTIGSVVLKGVLSVTVIGCPLWPEPALVRQYTGNLCTSVNNALYISFYGKHRKKIPVDFLCPQEEVKCSLY